MPENDDALRELRDENRELRDQLREARAEITIAKRESARALSALRQQLNPLYRALQAVFGEIEASGISDDGPAPTNARIAAVWENWKSKVGSSAKLIDALLLHGEMNTSQLSVATGFHRTTIPAHVFKLNKLGLLNKNGGKFSLKQL